MSLIHFSGAPWLQSSTSSASGQRVLRSRDFEIVEHVVADRNAIGPDFSARERPFLKAQPELPGRISQAEIIRRTRGRYRGSPRIQRIQRVTETFGKDVDDLRGAAAIGEVGSSPTSYFRKSQLRPQSWKQREASPHSGMCSCASLCFAHALEVLRIFLTGRAGSTDQTKILQRPTNFARIAYRTNSAVDETLSFRIADARWVSTVFTLRFRTAPTDLLVCPSAIN